MDSESPKTIWKSQRAKDHEYVQTINIELSTTLMNLEFTQQMSNDRASQASASLTSLLDQSSTTGQDRIQGGTHLLLNFNFGMFTKSMKICYEEACILFSLSECFGFLRLLS